MAGYRQFRRQGSAPAAPRVIASIVTTAGQSDVRFDNPAWHPLRPREQDKRGRKRTFSRPRAS